MPGTREGGGLTERIVCLPPELLAPILERKRHTPGLRGIPRIPLDTMLITILEKANEFVPSASGSILLDDPRQKLAGDIERDLIFVCSFGPTAERIVGERIPIDQGIVGAVYRSGASRVTDDACREPEFAGEYDRRFGYCTHSVLCVAIRIGDSVCGVIELMNRQGGGPYRERERELLEIFAQYISSTIQNAVDAKRIERMVRLDDLTGLANDRALHERLPAEVAEHVRSGLPLSVIFLDLDRFKEINDTHGHLAGSSTLAEFGGLFARTADRRGATLVRYGGDEFVALLPGTSGEEAAVIAERVRAETQARVFLAGRWGEDQEPLGLGGVITASLGVSTLEGPVPPGLTREMQTRLGVRLLQRADEAMYHSKSGGKNRVTTLRCAEAYGS